MENVDERRDLIVSRVLRFVQNIVREAEGQTTDITSLQDRAESFYGHVLRLTQAGVLVETVPGYFVEIYEDINQTSRFTELATSVFAPTIRCARRGRPRYLISEDTLSGKWIHRTVNSRNVMCIAEETHEGMWSLYFKSLQQYKRRRIGFASDKNQARVPKLWKPNVTWTPFELRPTRATKEDLRES